MIPKIEYTAYSTRVYSPALAGKCLLSGMQYLPDILMTSVDHVTVHLLKQTTLLAFLFSIPPTTETLYPSFQFYLYYTSTYLHSGMELESVCMAYNVKQVSYCNA